VFDPTYCAGPGETLCSSLTGVCNALEMDVCEEGLGLQTRWGDPQNFQSGLGYEGFADVPVVFDGTPFVVGALTHYNNPIRGNGIADVTTLTIQFTVTQPEFAQSTLTFDITVNETLNSAPCAFPSDTPCADEITVPGVTASTFSFTVCGDNYDFDILGILSDNANVAESYISNERQSNTVPFLARVLIP